MTRRSITHLYFTRHFIILIFPAILCLLLAKPSFALTTVSMEGTSVTLHWTAPGDDGSIGRASSYQIRCSFKNCGVDTLAWWGQATLCPGVPYPRPAGYLDSFTIQGLEPDSVYYFAIRAVDDAGNWSEVSNIYTNAYFLCADINNDDNINLMDVIFLMIYLYRHGPAPGQLANCDVNSDGIVNLMDGTYLVSYLYKGGPFPTCK